MAGLATTKKPWDESAATTAGDDGAAGRGRSVVRWAKEAAFDVPAESEGSEGRDVDEDASDTAAAAAEDDDEEPVDEEEPEDDDTAAPSLSLSPPAAPWPVAMQSRGRSFIGGRPPDHAAGVVEWWPGRVGRSGRVRSGAGERAAGLFVSAGGGFRAGTGHRTARAKALPRVRPNR